MTLYCLFKCLGLLFFFFSSRRRHTRFDCDWSSDVCSSDLSAEAIRQGDRKAEQAVEHQQARDGRLITRREYALRLSLVGTVARGVQEQAAQQHRPKPVFAPVQPPDAEVDHPQTAAPERTHEAL